MAIYSVVLFLVIGVALLLQLVLIGAAFRTRTSLGVLAFFLPFYVVTFGNHRLATVYRRQLAAAWWFFYILMIAMIVARA